ncbi:hypothetical protein Pfo_008312 [Paulownia fortunei]|nr:hypothetical protein Pfo_008312 [Paulownia fortunei]
MIFIRHYLSEDLKDEHIQIEIPYEIWTVILPRTQYDWQHLRLQDFKSVAEYNLALFKIESRLALSLPEAHVSSNISVGQFRRREHRFGCDARRGGGCGGPCRDACKDDCGGHNYLCRDDYPVRQDACGRLANNICNRCGMTEHWAKVCRTAQHLTPIWDRKPLELPDFSEDLDSMTQDVEWWQHTQT